MEIDSDDGEIIAILPVQDLWEVSVHGECEDAVKTYASPLHIRVITKHRREHDGTTFLSSELAHCANVGEDADGSICAIGAHSRVVQAKSEAEALASVTPEWALKAWRYLQPRKPQEAR